MDKHRCKNSADALVYVLDCTLATVCDLACKKSASKYELKRQISIAQFALDWCLSDFLDVSSTRGHSVVTLFDKSVEKWAQQFKP